MGGWLSHSNRKEHFFYAIPAGFLFTILFVAGLAIGMELKDYQKKGGKWDWKDLFATLLGGFIGQSIMVLILLLTNILQH